MAKKLNIQAALMKSGANMGGGIAAAAINKIGFVKKQKMIIRGGAKLVIGALLPSFLKLKGKSAETVNDAVAGWNAVAGIELVNGLITKNGANPDKALSIAGIGTGNITGYGSEYEPPTSYSLGSAEGEGDSNIM